MASAPPENWYEYKSRYLIHHPLPFDSMGETVLVVPKPPKFCVDQRSRYEADGEPNSLGTRKQNSHRLANEKGTAVQNEMLNRVQNERLKKTN